MTALALIILGVVLAYVILRVGELLRALATFDSEDYK